MDLTLIRNATLRLRFGGIDFLIDPMLGTCHSIRPMGDSPERNPTVDLPYSIDQVIDGAEVVIVSHLHPDHFDEAACGIVPRHLPVLCQSGDGDRLAPPDSTRWNSTAHSTIVASASHPLQDSTAAVQSWIAWGRSSVCCSKLRANQCCTGRATPCCATPCGSP